MFPPKLSSSSFADDVDDDDDAVLAGISPHLGICALHTHPLYAVAQSSHPTTELYQSRPQGNVPKLVEKFEMYEMRGLEIDDGKLDES